MANLTAAEVTMLRDMSIHGPREYPKASVICESLVKQAFATRKVGGTFNRTRYTITEPGLEYLRKINRR